MAITSRFVFTELSAIISDYMFYSDNAKEIDEWLEERECERQGMVIKFSDNQTQLLFQLRWV